MKSRVALRESYPSQKPTLIPCDFQGMPTQTLPAQKVCRLASSETASPVKLFPQSLLCQQRKENSSRVGGHRLTVHVSVAALLPYVSPQSRDPKETRKTILLSGAGI